MELRARASILPAEEGKRVRWRAKQTVDNRLAGRAAKGAILFSAQTRSLLNRVKVEIGQNALNLFHPIIK